ncbi:SDR family NAD(P)-dependent oxidoreductase [Suttonella sp. R2A3]|uniref:SDR family NAD(P)-dependent oxidoreductase n=1 Tax=Suttonella sp. R2A3 TaxID=2908648 RepID=UPI001F3AF3AB|nr:SDR family NAD(P)-dependent oxidoreductase [Suttonella sp. R2A3]UJF24951.1 SDR family NAD(P)-dependent oxidoreductase [Suttonella sp. R2A3]
MGYGVSGKNVLITGAAMGMGRLYALRAAREGATTLHLWDQDVAGMQETADLVREASNTPIEVITTEVDLSDSAVIDQQLTTLLERGAAGEIDVLINNAGVVSGNAYFWQDEKPPEWCMQINTLAPMQITRALLPQMIERKSQEMRILNIASAAATVSNPRMAVYCASKWAMLGWGDSLRLELINAGHEHIKLTTFCPSYISTGMFAGAKKMFLTPILTPEQAVNAAWQAMLDGKAVRYLPWSVRLAMIIKALLPQPWWDWTAKHILKVTSSMDEFRGH